MATLVLGVAGSIIGGPVGGAIGAFIGAKIDAAIVNALTPPQRIGKLDELRLGGSDEGGPAPWVSGPRCRTEGQVIWTSQLREVQRSSGGGFFGGPRIINYNYFVDVAVAFARRECASMARFWLGSEIIYTSVTGITLSSNEISFTSYTNVTWSGAFWNGSQWVANIVTWRQMLVTHDGGDNALAAFIPGGQITVSGAADPRNNGTYDVWAVSSNVDGISGRSRIKLLLCSDSTAIPNPACTPAVAAAAGPTITLTQTAVPLIPGYMDSMTFYPGSSTQNPDPTIEADLGVGNTPAYRGTAYVVLKNLNVTKLAGTLPSFAAELKQANTKTVEELVTELCEVSGQTQIEVDAVDLAGLDCQGFVTTGIFSPRDALRSVMMAHGLDWQQSGRTIRFFQRKNADVIAIADNDRGARQSGSSAPRLMELEPSSALSMPQEIVVTAIDPARDLQPGSAIARKTANPINNKVAQSFPLVLTTSEMQLAAKRILWLMHSASLTARVQLPFNNIEIQEGDIIQGNDADGLYHTIRVKQLDRGSLNGLLRIEGQTIDLGVFDQTLDLGEDEIDTESENPELAAVSPPAPIKLMVLDLPSLTDETKGLSGFLFAGSVFVDQGLREKWFGYSVYYSRNGEDFKHLYDTHERAIMGVASNTLGPTNYPQQWDYENTVTIVLDNDEDSLESLPEEQVLALGANMLLVGGEIIQFVTATLTAPRTYVLSQLRRGCRGTERHIGTHTGGTDSGGSGVWEAGVWEEGVWEEGVWEGDAGDSGGDVWEEGVWDGVWDTGVWEGSEGGTDEDESLLEWCLLLSGPGVGFFELPSSHGANYTFRAVPSSVSVDDAMLPMSAKTSSETRRPFSVYGVRAVRNAAGDIDVSWSPRTRSTLRTLSGSSIARSEDIDVYNIDVCDEAGEVFATYTVSDVEWTYTASQQMTDFGGLQDPLHIRIYQMSSFLHRGQPHAVTV